MNVLSLSLKLYRVSNFDAVTQIPQGQKLLRIIAILSTHTLETFCCSINKIFAILKFNFDHSQRCNPILIQIEDIKNEKHSEYLDSIPFSDQCYLDISKYAAICLQTLVGMKPLILVDDLLRNTSSRGLSFLILVSRPRLKRERTTWKTTYRKAGIWKRVRSVDFSVGSP